MNRPEPSTRLTAASIGCLRARGRRHRGLRAARPSRERIVRWVRATVAGVIRPRRPVGRAGSGIDFSRFEDITYEAFRRRATDPSLSLHEKIGFPDAYREGKEELILDDIASKLTRLSLREQVVVDVGAGCGGLATADDGPLRRAGTPALPGRFARDARAPARGAARQHASPGASPTTATTLLDELRGRATASSPTACSPASSSSRTSSSSSTGPLELLAEGGQLLLGDLANVSKRKRFFASEAGVRFHQEFMATSERPDVALQRARARRLRRRGRPRDRVAVPLGGLRRLRRPAARRPALREPARRHPRHPALRPVRVERYTAGPRGGVERLRPAARRTGRSSSTAGTWSTTATASWTCRSSSATIAAG